MNQLVWYSVSYTKARVSGGRNSSITSEYFSYFVAILYYIFNIMECIVSAYLGPGGCRGAHLPVGRGERWDATKTLQPSVAVRGAGMKFLELWSSFSGSSCAQWAEA